MRYNGSVQVSLSPEVSFSKQFSTTAAYADQTVDQFSLFWYNRLKGLCQEKLFSYSDSNKPQKGISALHFSHVYKTFEEKNRCSKSECEIILFSTMWTAIYILHGITVITIFLQCIFKHLRNENKK